MYPEGTGGSRQLCRARSCERADGSVHASADEARKHKLFRLLCHRCLHCVVVGVSLFFLSTRQYTAAVLPSLLLAAVVMPAMINRMKGKPSRACDMATTPTVRLVELGCITFYPTQPKPTLQANTRSVFRLGRGPDGSKLSVDRQPTPLLRRRFSTLHRLAICPERLGRSVPQAFRRPFSWWTNTAVIRV